MSAKEIDQAYHYRVIARALKEIDAPHGGALSLQTLAERLSMSPAHFQRVFSAWVGVSPKRYQQYLALDHAKHLLAKQRKLVDVANETGLSGTGRLHDLFIRWEAMSPGEFARAGEGLIIRWGWFSTPFGEALAMGTERGLCGIGFNGEWGRESTFNDLARRWPHCRLSEDPAPLRNWVEAAFSHSGETAILAIGGPFQIKVWQALLAVPSGAVTTYGELATATGHPGADRAAGTAVGRNPVGFLIPCHRVIRKSGSLGGYHWGLPLKRAMLAWEAARSDHPTSSAA